MSLTSNYQHILNEIKETAIKAGRQPDDVALIAVSKNHPVEQILEVYQAGCVQFGENRVQEALPKIEALPENLEWHLIGSLQKNKVNKAVENFTLIHSVDSLELAEKISEVSEKLGKKTAILLQVNTSGEASKHGFSPENFEAIVEAVKAFSGVRLEGLMTMAPFDAAETEIHKYFARLRELRDQYHLHHLSMGMSHDYKIAIEEGATLLRVGTAIFQE